MEIKAFFDKNTNTLTYVVFDVSTHEAIILDPVLDYDPSSAKVTKDSIHQVIQFIREGGLKPIYVMETHAHADHLSGAQALKKFFPGIQVVIGEKIIEVQKTFKNVFNLGNDFRPDGSQFDQLLKIGETYKVGNFSFKILPTPGHTPACSSYLFNNKVVFTGDALFMPDYGTGRCDFPSGSAEDLYHSIMGQLYTLPDETIVLVGHDYLPNNRELRYESTIGEEKKHNIRIKKDTPKEEFVKFRKERDATLSTPKLLYPSVQVNILAGRFPPPESNEVSYLKIPVHMG